MKLIEIFKSASTDHGLELFSERATKAIEALLIDKKGKPYIRCQVRNSEVQAKPEEVVRQFWLYRIIHHYKYPPSRLTVEYPITFGRDSSKRADIVIFDKDSLRGWGR
jgi:type I restriction enzyme M protein